MKKILHYTFVAISIIAVSTISSLIATSNGRIWPLVIVCVPFLFGMVHSLIELDLIEKD